MKPLLEKVKEKVQGKNIKVIFADGHEAAILKAGEMLVKNHLLTPFFVGRRTTIEKICRENKIDMVGFHVRDPYFDAGMETFVNDYYHLRKHKGVSFDEAREIMAQSHYFGAMMVKNDLVDGMVSGFSSSTKPFLPAFQIIGTKNVNKASSYFLMIKENTNYLYSDCGLIIDPTSEELAEIAITSAKTARLYGMNPIVAMLSFSTKGSANHEMVDKVRKATEIVRKKDPKLVIDGEVQFDAAINERIAEKKKSTLKGKANVFIFPNIDAGNIAYKITERLAGFKAIGPLLQGLNKPINDMSRGADVEAIVNIACITAYEALMNDRR